MHSRTRKRSSEVHSRLSGSSASVQQHSSTVQKAAAAAGIPTWPRSPKRANGGRSTSKAILSTGHKARSVQIAAKRLTDSPTTAVRQHMTTKHSGSKRRCVKSVQSRGTQLDCTPVPFDIRSSLALPSDKRVPRILRQLEQTPLETASLAWNHYNRSASLARQTKHPQQPQISANDPSGSSTDISVNVF